AALAEPVPPQPGGCGRCIRRGWRRTRTPIPARQPALCGGRGGLLPGLYAVLESRLWGPTRLGPVQPGCAAHNAVAGDAGPHRRLATNAGRGHGAAGLAPGAAYRRLGLSKYAAVGVAVVYRLRLLQRISIR